MLHDMTAVTIFRRCKHTLQNIPSFIYLFVNIYPSGSIFFISKVTAMFGNIANDGEEELFFEWIKKYVPKHRIEILFEGLVYLFVAVTITRSSAGAIFTPDLILPIMCKRGKFVGNR